MLLDVLRLHMRNFISLYLIVAEKNEVEFLGTGFVKV
jgi:hypothetical protein